MPLIHPSTHTIVLIGCHARYQPARQEQLGVRCLARGGIDPANLWLPNDNSYLLSHIAPSDNSSTMLPISQLQPKKQLPNVSNLKETVILMDWCKNSIVHHNLHVMKKGQKEFSPSFQHRTRLFLISFPHLFLFSLSISVYLSSPAPLHSSH